MHTYNVKQVVCVSVIYFWKLINMDSIKARALIMDQYALKLITFAVNTQFTISPYSKECIEIIWECQQEIYKCINLPTQDKRDFFNNTNVHLGYLDQLFNIGKQSVYVKAEGFTHISKADVDKIILI